MRIDGDCESSRRFSFIWRVLNGSLMYCLMESNMGLDYLHSGMVRSLVASLTSVIVYQEKCSLCGLWW